MNSRMAEIGRAGLLTVLVLALSLTGGGPASAAPGTAATPVPVAAEGHVLPAAEGSSRAAAPATCTLPTYGGTYYCGYGEHFYNIGGGVEQAFVIGTDYAIWTRWKRANGSLSSWTSLGGTIHPTVTRSNFLMCVYGGNLHVNVRGTDRDWYLKTRVTSTGKWTADWAVNLICMV